MKKFYLLVLCSLLTVAAHATTWYSQGSGDPSQLLNWNSSPTGGGSSPSSFTTSGDVFIMQTNMSGGSGTWTLGAGTTLQLNSVTFTVYFTTINCGNLYITGSSNWYGYAYDYVYISGNFALNGTSYCSNPPDWNYFYFVGPSSPTSPQTADISTTVSGSYTYLYANAGAYVKLITNSGWSQGDPFTVYSGATFDCSTYTWGGNQGFTLSSGATLYCGMPGGINATLTTTGTKTLSASASYGFDGTSAQVTGALLPASITSPGQLIINNTSGVTLSQNTSVTTTPTALVLTNGILNTGGYSMTVPGISTGVTGAGASNYVSGNLTKTISGYSAINYEVGDADYAPVLLTLSSAGTAGSLAVQSTAGLHPQATSSGFGTSNMVSHYWTISSSSAAGPATVTPTFTYNASDILGGSNNGFSTQEYTGGSWLSSPLTSTNTSSPYTTTPTTGVALGSVAGDYIAGATVPYAYATPNSLSYGIVGIGASAVLSTTLAGGNLLAGPLTVTAPTNFLVSTSATGPWTTSINLSYTPPALAGTPIYVQFNPTASTTYTGTVSVTGGGIASAYTFSVTGIGQPPCSGTPTAGTTVASPTSGNGGTLFSLSLSGSTTAAGLTYQWQSSPNGSTWTNIYGATNSTFNFTGLTGNTYFLCIVSCGAFSASSTSQLITSTGAAASSCTPSSYYSPCTYYAGTSGNPVIINGVSGSISDASTCGSGPSGHPYYYDNSGTMSVTFYQGGSYTSTIGSGYYYTSGQVWVDFNDDGIFQQSETIGGYQKATCCTTTPRQTPTLTIPANATPGTHRMRVVNGYTVYYAPGYSSFYPSYPKMNPCPNTTSTQYYMDSRDYTATILLAPAAVSSSKSSVAFGNVTTGAGSIPPQYITLTGTNLSGTPVTVTPPANFAVSLDGINWYTTSLSVGYTPGYPVGNMLPTNVYIQFNPTSGTSYSGNLTISGAGLLSSVTVALSGTGVSACSGSPIAGAAAISPTSGNGATVFALTVPGASASGGMLYQWQSSPNGITWTNIQGGVFPSYSVTGLSATTQYRCVVTCITGSSATSTPVTATFTGGVATSSCTPSSYYSPCTYYAGTTGNPVIINGASGTSISDASACGSGTGGSSYYYNNVSSSVTFNQGGAYTATIGSGYYYNSGQVWIDFNDDGVFSQSETVGGYNQPVCCVVGPRASVTISIPANATPGAHRMRVVNGYSSLYGPGYSTSYPAYPQMNPCPYSPTTVYYADTRDYTAVVALPACSGTPNAGIVSAAGLAIGCTPYSTNVVNVGEDLTAGMSYQWQSSSSALGGFANIAGATNSVYSPTISTVGTTYLRMSAKCGNSGITSYSQPTPAFILNAPPTAITGSLAICNGATGTLSSTPSGGTWSSGSFGVATIGSSSGIMTGVAAGNSVITYTLPTSCFATATATINPLPAAIGGTTVVCQGSSVSLSDVSSGGTWSSSDVTLATVGSAGLLTGVSGGTPNITYTLPTGCLTSTPVTVNPTAPITGLLSLCSGYGTTLSDALPGGVWSSSTPSVATIGSATGSVTSLTAGTTTIYYTLPTGCISSAVVGVTNTPGMYTISGGGNICPGSGAHIYVSGSDYAVGYQLFRNGVATGPLVIGTGLAIDMGLQTLAGLYTVTANPGSPCAVNMTGSLTITILPAPTVYNVTGGGGFCAGGTGVHIGLNGSNTGFTYQLYNGSVPAGLPVAGTGTLVDFGLLSSVGTYTVTATNSSTGCTGGMNGNATVSFNAAPTAYTVTGGGGYCAGGTGAVIGLSNSSATATYQLMLGTTPAGSPVAGAGGAITFGPQTTAGTYTVIATDNTTGCTKTMTGSKVVTVNPLPTVYAVTGGGAFCAGGAGVHIGLSGSNTGVTYTLYLGGVATARTAAGTGGAVDFGLVNVAGIYTVVGNNATTGCTNNMSGSATITTNPLPNFYGLTGGGAFCQGGAGVHVGLSGSDLGTTYYLYRGATVVGGGSGTTAPVDFGLETIPGIYTVSATNPGTGCSASMGSSVSVVVNLAPNVYSLTGGGSFCAGGTGVTVGLSSSDANITYKLYDNSLYTGTALVGIGTALNFGTYTAGGNYTVIASDNTTACMSNMAGTTVINVNPLPVAHNVTGGGTYCAGGTGLHVGLDGSDAGVRYQLMNGASTVGAPVTGTGGALDFGLTTTTGTFTVVATNIATACVNNMAGSATVATTPLPAVYATGGGGSYCAGGTGVTVTLSNSDAGTNYQLYRGTTAVGSSVAGTGSSISFGPQTNAGTYTVVATNASGCTRNMSGSVAVSITALPAAYTVTGGGSYCAGGAGVHVGLNNSATGVTYQLYNGSSTVGGAMTGTGMLIDFGVQTTAGAYTVTATSTSTGCTNSMTGTASVAINPLPAAFAVTGGGSYCAGSAAPHIGLASSATGTSYQLYSGTSGIGSAVTGSGGTLDFGAQALATTYTVNATNTSTGCVAVMTGSATVAVNPLPALHTITGGGHYCIGGTGVAVGLDGTTSGTNYQLYLGGAAVGSPMSGSGPAISFGLQTAPGSYTVQATNTTTGCATAMTGSTAVSASATPVVYAVTGGGAYCPSGSGVAIGLGGSDPGVSYQLYNGAAVGSPVTGTGSSISFGLHTGAGTYTVVATGTPLTCVANMSGSASVSIATPPVVHNVTGGGGYCAGGTGINIGLDMADAGVSYQLYNGTVAEGAPVTGSGSVLSFGPQPAAGTYTVKATGSTTGCTTAMSGSALVTINTLPVSYSMTGGGGYCAGSTGAVVGLSGSDPGVSYQLYNGALTSGPAVMGTGSALDLGPQTSGSYSVTAVNTATGCVNNMTGAVAVVMNALPAAYTVTGGGAYCAGGTGVAVQLSGSAPGVSYQLYNSGVVAGAAVTGSGSVVNFGLKTSAGSYTVTATDPATGCINHMTGTASVAVDPLPLAYAITGSSPAYCAGSAGVTLSLPGSDAGVNYQLYLGSSPVGSHVGGTGFAVSFGPQTGTGSYSVVATNATSGCTSNMPGSFTVAVNPVPSIYTVSGGGSFCSGGAGVHVDLSGSTSGILYQLYNAGVATGSPVAGAGTTVDFGAQTAAGSYTVKATNPATGCSSAMTGSASVGVNPAPAAFAVIGGGSYCSGGTGIDIGLAGSATGVKYQLKLGTVLVGSIVNGTGTALDLGHQTTAGTYTVVATNAVNGCTANMTGSATVATMPLPVMHTVTGGGGYCAGGAGVHVGLNTADSGVTYQLYNGGTSVGGPLAGAGTALDLGLQTTAGTYTVQATNTVTGCSSNMSGSVPVIIEALPAVYAVTGGGSYCSGGTGVHIGLSSSASGVNYALSLGSGVVTTLPGTGAALDFGLQTGAGAYTVAAANATTGCSSSMTGSASVAVNATVAPGVTITSPGGGSGCTGRMSSFTAVPVNGGAAPVYQWYVNSVPSGTSANTFSYPPAAGDVVSVKMTSSAACATPLTATGNMTMTVNTPEIPGVVLTSDKGTEVCQGTTITIAAVPVFGGAAPTYVWVKNGVTDTTAHSANYSYAPLNGDNVYCILHSSYYCRVYDTGLSNTVNMKTDAALTPAVTVSATGNGYLSHGGEGTFTATVINGISSPSYQWSVNGVTASGATLPVFTTSGLSDGDVVSCDVTSGGVCSGITGSGSLTVHVGVGVAQVAASAGNIIVSPNPNTGSFRISGTLSTIGNEEVTLELEDLLGRVVYQSSVVAKNGKLDEKVQLSGSLANGMYLLNLRSDSDNQVFHIVVKQ